MKVVKILIPNRVYNVILDVLPMVVLFSIVMSSVRLVTVAYSKEKIQWRKEIKNLIYIVYTFILFVLVTSTDFESVGNNFIPFKEILRYKSTSGLFFRNVIGNILLFLPFGYLITDMVQSKANKCNPLITLLLTSITSISTELIQLFIGRSFDIDDIILNILGGLLGYIIYKILHIILKQVRKKYDNVFVDLVSCVILLFIIILIIYLCCEVIIWIK